MIRFRHRRRCLIAALVAALLPMIAPAADPPDPPVPAPLAGSPQWTRTRPAPRTSDEPRAPLFGEPPAQPPLPPDQPEAEWWRDLLRAWIAEDFAAAGARTPADSALVLLLRLGLPPDLAGRAQPDSALADRFRWLALREGYLPADVRPLLFLLGRAEDYRDLCSRAAAMYDEFLQAEIITPD